MTRGQIINLYTTAREAGLDHETVKAELQAIYGVNTSTDLAPHQYREYLAHLAGLAAKTRIAPPAASPSGKPELGYYHNLEALQAFVNNAVEFGRLWPGAPAQDTDLEQFALVLDSCRNYRGRALRLSQKQVEWLVDRVNSYPLWAFRIAAHSLLTQHRDKNERYFTGIMEHQVDDAKRREALALQKQQPAAPALHLL